MCIGGVKLDNLREILEAGATRVCIVSDLLLAADPANRTAEVKFALSETRPVITGVPEQYRDDTVAFSSGGG